ncbi:MAG TPA: transglycosylase domain-containing protein [Actinomycetota bacterium]|nr:transglycosylase domain-containing protein [Actinomycetota bacterium]
MQDQLDNAPNLGIPARCALAAVALVFLTGLGIGGLALYMMFAPIELPKPLEGAKAASTQILGADGAVIEQWHGPINRTPVSLRKMSRNLQQAAVAAEDARFHQRGAVDLRAVMRAAKANLLNGSYVQGGSTISQQYAKNVYVGNARSISRKIREARVAYRLERDLGKAKVLEGYLNTVYFGRGAYGVEAASKIYFGKSASDVTVSEAALLIAMIKSPDAYSPYYHPARSETRRHWVLERMEKLGMLSPSDVGQAVRAKPVLTPASAAHPKYGWYMDALRTYLIGKYGSEKVYAGGLKVQTTLDPQAQQAAETTIANALPDVKDPYAALVSIDPATGYVTAIVGGRDYSQEKYNIALQGRRQPGSSFKPFVLAAALEAGIPVSAGYRAPRTICPKGWGSSCVSNFGRAGYGRMNLEQATINSVNTVYAQLVLDVGPKKVVDLARRAGIPGPEWLPRRSGCEVSADDRCGTEIQAVPAMALGTEEVTPLELASGYATLAAGGVYREPKLVSRVEDANGKVLEEGPSVGIQAVKPSVAEAVNGILAKVITRGTGTRADFGRPAAGKTGTAQDHSNAWFSGYTPQLATSVWMGYRASNKPLANVQGVSRVTGGSIPAEMWRDYMKGVSDRLPPTLDLAESPANGSFSRANHVDLEGTAADEDGMVQGIEVSIDSGAFGSAGVQCRACQEPAARWSYESPSALPDGEHHISVRSFDKAGHRSEAVSRKITVDTQRPALQALASTGGSADVKASFNEAVACAGISPAAFDVASGKNRLRVVSVECRGEAAQVLNLTLRDSVRGGDLVSVSMRGRSGVPADRAGNPSGADSQSTQASNVGPLVTMASRGGRPDVVTAAGVELKGTAVDRDGTLEAIEVSVDDGAYSAAGVDCFRCGRGGETGWTFRPRTGLAHGKHKLEFRSIDNAGAKSGVGSARVTVDAVAPSLAAVRSEGASSAVEVSFSEPVACKGNAAGQFSARIGGRRASVVSGTCAGNSAQLTVSPSPQGGDNVELSVRGPSGRGQAVTDVAGNPVSGGGTTVTASNRPPVLQVDTDVSEVLVNPALKPGSKVRVEGTASDPDGRVQSVEASVDGGPFTARLVKCRGCGRSQEVTFTIDVEQAAPGSRRTVAFRARDGASAFSSPEGSGVASDAEAPVFKTISARSGVSTVTAGFSEPIDCTTVDRSFFRVTSNGKARNVLATLCAGDAQDEVQLRLAGRIKPGENIAVQLTGGLTDPAGNAVQPVTLKGLKVPKGH